MARHRQQRNRWRANDWREPQLELRYAVMGFTREVQFPRFKMAKGERYAFFLSAYDSDWLDMICLGGSFPFEGGECHADDVEIVHVGTGDIDWDLLIGHV